MLRRFLTILAAAILLGGCASTHPSVNQRMQAYTYHYSQFDAFLSWDVRWEGAKLVVDGLFKNVRYSAMQGVEVWIATIAPTGKTTATSVAFLLPDVLKLDDVAAFRVKLPAPQAPGSKLRFTYKYRGLDGGGPDGGGDVENWMQSFDAEIPSSP